MSNTGVRGQLEGLVKSLGGTALGAAGEVAGATSGVVDKAVPFVEGDQPERLIRAARVLTEAGVASPERPDVLARMLKTLLDWDMTPAAGFIVSAIRYPDEPAIVDEKGSLTFAEVDRRTNALANALRDEGIDADDSVAIMCRDHRWFIEATVALGKLGATALLYNTHFAGPQLKEVTEREDPAAVIYDEEFGDALEEALEGRKSFVAWTDDDSTDGTVEDLIEGGDDSAPDSPDKPGKTTLLTSGSTGTPKGASRSSPDVIEAVGAMFSKIPLRAREPTFYAAPLFHAWGFLQFSLGLLLSSTYVLRRKFDPEETLKAIDENDVTTLVIVPIMLQRILDLDDEVRDKHDASSLRVVASSGGALSGELAQKWMDEFGDNLYNMYGSTEVAWAAIGTPEELRDAPGTAGTAPPGTSLRILDEESKDPKDTGETGEVFVGNRMLFEGYTGEEDDEEMVDGHMTTGDLGYLDDKGRLFIEGRSDDMIVSGGENVYPEEVEEKLGEHESVAEAAVIGVEDEEFGERLKAFVVKDGEVSEDDLKGYVKENLADYKVPREIEFVDELPRKPQGKVDKKKLEEDSEGEDESKDSSDD
jgi:acyl-CoA synthetase (AMP-forming)/AMP-acid ligase II